jgi:hypothetical protein
VDKRTSTDDHNPITKGKYAKGMNRKCLRNVKYAKLGLEQKKKAQAKDAAEKENR